SRRRHTSCYRDWSSDVCSSDLAVGAALANRDKGIVTVSIEGDGDLMYAPGVLWTAAHHKIPILMVMHNNRAYHQEVMHLQKMARSGRASCRERVKMKVGGVT